MRYDSTDSVRLAVTDLVAAWGHRYVSHGLFFFEWESDVLSVSRGGHIHEIELKVSRTDFLRDFSKPKHDVLLPPIFSIHVPDRRRDGRLNRPSHFWYAAPEGLLGARDVPTYAGLIEVSRATGIAYVSREAPRLHAHRITSVDEPVLRNRSRTWARRTRVDASLLA